jgi:hypothetical protein
MPRLESPLQRLCEGILQSRLVIAALCLTPPPGAIAVRIFDWRLIRRRSIVDFIGHGAFARVLQDVMC